MMDLLTTFKLHSVPFTREIATDHLLDMPHLDQAFTGLERAVTSRMSAALIAPAGAGKTGVLRRLRAALPEARYQVHYVKVTCLSKRDMCREIASAVGATPAGTYPWLVRRLQERFEQCFEHDGVRPVLLMDEAHDMRPDVLGILRLLTNFEMDSRLMLSVVLAGQPRLETLLKRPELHDVATRLTHVATLRLMSRDETAHYIDYRCTLAGGAQTPFDRPAIDALFEIGRGNLRATDELARGALEVAAASGSQVVSQRDVATARKHLLV